MSKSYITKIGDKKESFESGAIRADAAGKGAFALVSPIGERRLADVYERGKAYGARNWEQGMPLERMLESCKRHINNYETIALFNREGIPLCKLPANCNPDEDHLAAAAWNLYGIMHLEEVKPEFDDMNKKAVTLAVEPASKVVKKVKTK